ncbi:hypothetical protein DAPPUDRAFT_320477 [Daphnia pulex]|uniref:Uncharacterized protein n=1 Tax=Daphnia pulex TaxID=6669 RepID=E9GPY6_DAPPU|nr:hypothetical protein DAPPUDRAFT_320477 [Daphnia pulex]|eukprot:EFX78469.1 hypothetical protein DAPPUDRAFT_320477 [Daphnia pulex]
MAKSIEHLYPSTENTSSKVHGRDSKTQLFSYRISLEDILGAEKFLREQVLDSPIKRKNYREEMLEKFAMTRKSHRKFIAKGKIEDEFKFLSNSSPETIDNCPENRGKMLKNKCSSGETSYKKARGKNYFRKTCQDTKKVTSLEFQLLLHNLLLNKTRKEQKV